MLIELMAAMLLDVVVVVVVVVVDVVGCTRLQSPPLTKLFV